MTRGMAVINRVREFVDSRAMTAYQFWKAVEKGGGMTEPTAYRLYNNPFQIPSGKALESIYQAYPDTTPNDWIAFISDTEAAKIRKAMEREKRKKQKRSPK